MKTPQEHRDLAAPTLLKKFATGATLDNGATVIDAWIGKVYGVVLAMNPGSAQEYMTWEFSTNVLNHGLYWGHYNSKFYNAVEDYRDRVRDVKARMEETS